MLKALMAVRLRAFWASFSGVSRTKKPSRGKTVLFVLLMLYCLVVFGILFFGLFSALADAFLNTTLSWLFFAVFLLLCFALMFIGSLFATKAQLFEAKDNALLLALPIPSSVILFSRMLSLGLYNLLFELLVAVPFLLAWALFGTLSASGVGLLLLVLVSLNLFCLAVVSLFAWLLSRITSKMRNKTMVSTVFSLLFLGAYFYVISKANALIAALAQNGQKLAASLGAVAPLQMLASAMAQQNLAEALLPLACMLLLFAAVYALLSHFLPSILGESGTSAKIVYRERALRVSSIDSALLQRETARLLSSSGYLLNAGMGVVFSLAAAVALPFAKQRMLLVLSEMAISRQTLTLFALGAICLLQSTITFSACSVSLEGESLWIVRSLPVSSQQVLRAKLQLHTRIAAFAAAAAGISASLCLDIDAVPVVLISVLFAALCARIGLVENLRHPNVNWTNELQAIKQGIALLLSMLLSLAAILVPAGAYLLLQRFGVSCEVFLYGVLIVYAALNVLLGRWLNGRGAELFEEIS